MQDVARERALRRKVSERQGRVARLGAALRRLDSQPGLVEAARRARQRLPGDSSYGDPLSTAGNEAPDLLARQLATLNAERPSMVRELGFSALQMWQGLSEAQGRGYGDRELAIVFSDIVEFSTWALEVGDASALQLLREVDLALVSVIDARGGAVVKRLGDGIMATFPLAQSALDAAHEGHAAVAHIDVEGHTPLLRTGIHVGRPRRLGGDYFGVDVNVAARVAAAARGGEVLVTESVPAHLDAGRVNLRRRWRFQAKGTPERLKVYIAEPTPGAA